MVRAKTENKKKTKEHVDFHNHLDILTTMVFVRRGKRDSLSESLFDTRQ